VQVNVERARIKNQIVSGQKMSWRVRQRKDQLREKQELLRDALSLLRNYGPLWYKEELDSRLAKAVAGRVYSVDRLWAIKAKKTTHSDQMAEVQNVKCQEKQELLRDVWRLLRTYGPLWYDEKLDARLTKSLIKRIEPNKLSLKAACQMKPLERINYN
jgi:hypothetical protein